jgi:hypothetical protein
MIFPSQPAANERFCYDHNFPLEVMYSYAVNSIRLRGILRHRRIGKVMPVVMSTGWVHKIVNFSSGPILYDLLSDSLHILTRLLHSEKVYHYCSLNDYREDQLDELDWGLTMFMIYLNLIKPEAVLVGYYRLMTKREGELTDEEWMQRYEHRCIVAKQIYEKSRMNTLWKQWNDSVILPPDDMKFFLPSIAFKNTSFME